ncbi:ABC transporter permease [Thermococcus sp. AM4]|uniref:ABC transporter permease n=1 Tax=Thermococcus sp. (strain AM4) TaxID=246969 RepID=UPI0001870F73|nr:ABC transporter permease [Thermococcus sp. AM4]EEB73620.1 ABC-type dipeptide/oligopeptide transport system, probable permease component [Thermococcus sp. AM4]
MGYGKYLVFRIINALIILIIATFIMSALFVKVTIDQNKANYQDALMNWERTTGNKIRQQSGEKAYEEAKKAYEEQLRRQYNLDKGYWSQVIDKTISTLKLDFGQTQTPIWGTNNVRKIILTAIPRSVILFTTATIITMLIGIFLGVRAANNPGSLFDRTLSIFALLTYSLPTWWTGMMFILIFAYKLGWFPLSSMFMPGDTILDKIHKIALPVMTFVFVAFGGWAWTTRNIMIGTLQEDFIMAARAKGLPERKVIYGHALRAAAPPIVTMVIFSLLGSLGGAIISEQVFQYPGMGLLYWTALNQGEVNLVIGLTYFSVVLYLTGVVLADMLYGFLDPRVKVGASANM